MLLRDVSLRGSFITGCYFISLENKPEWLGAKYISLLLISSLLSTPFEVVTTKMTTQQFPKYTSIVQSLRTIQNQETIFKLFSGFHFNFFNLLASATFYGFFYEKMDKFVRGSQDIESILYE